MSTFNIKTEKMIKELLRANTRTREDLMSAKRKIAKKYGAVIPQNSDVLKFYKGLLAARKIKRNAGLEKILRKRAVRTMSGIAPVAVLTKPFPCPGKCAYCPTEKNVPQSYLANEPAVMRAIRCGYDPYVQVQQRLRALLANGHRPEKIELIVIGGTWSVLPKKYKYHFVSECFRGANEFNLHNVKRVTHSEEGIKKFKKKLLSEQKKNEKARYKIIGVTLETRPDYINSRELLEMRELGATRVELGVQAIDDEILKLNRRGHGVRAIADATALLRKYGFKITYHLMPGLPGSTSAKDLKMFRQLFSDERFKPDQIKFYPTVVTRGSLLYRWWRLRKYKPYSGKILENLIIACKKAVPRYVRIIRLIRDIPGESIIAGNKITNLRQIVADKGVRCDCIRCREAKDKPARKNDLKMNIVKYAAAGGKEYFLSYDSKDGRTLYGFCRLRLPDAKKDDACLPRAITGAALVRELHIYGELMPAGAGKKIQHIGLGKKLLAEAEKIARKKGFKKISVISGAGVRNYYRKRGYILKESYMVKKIK